jgi:acyl dehydratase
MAISAVTLSVGDEKTLRIWDDLTRTQIVMYAGASGDYNPLHSDERYTTEAAGYPGVFSHGMLSMGASGRVVTDWFGAASVRYYGVRFTGQVWPGDQLTTTVTVTGIREEDGEHLADLSVETVNGAGATVVSGTAVVLLAA